MNWSLVGRRLFGLAVNALLIGMLPADARAQQSGTVTGVVVDGSTQQPLPGVQVFVSGTNRSALTNQQGRYLILGVGAGQHTLRASIIGYGAASQVVEVQAGASVTVDFALSVSAVELDALVVNAVTGQAERRRELGNTVANINLAEVDLAPVQTFSQLLQGRAAGVSVLQSAGTSGTGARVRIRGSNSISLSNEPMIIVDGIQVDNAATSFAVGLGGQSISRLNDFSPEEIESIEILKGPAASAMYGTAAANGVIQITTKRGRAGTARWNVFTEYGQKKDVTTYPANWLGVTTTPSGGLAVCDLSDVAAGNCTQTELRSWNPLMEAPPFRTGVNKTVGMNVAGGNDQMQYFVAGSLDNEDGIYENNSVDRLNLRANMDAQVRDDLNLSVRTGYTRANLSLPANDNAVEGFIGAGVLGSASDNETTRGYFAYPNEYREVLNQLQFLHRFVASGTANWRPLSWLAFNATGGMDLMSRKDVDAVAPGIWSISADEDNAIGRRGVFAALIRNYTGRANAVGTFDVTPTITSTTSVGTELRQDRLERSDASGFNMLPGTNSLGSLSERFAVNEFDQTQRTISFTARQQFGWQDRVFLSGSIRGDRNSNFGQQFGFQWYPSLSTSWVIGEEAWFPRSEFLSSMRLRAAWGRSGLMPAFRTAEQYYSATVATIRSNSVPAITIGGAGNTDLRPEQSTEWEFGFDAGLLNDRVGLEFAYYDKTSTDALVSRRLAPSLGSSTTQTVNLGQVTNSGFEALMNARVLSLDNVSWDAMLSFSTNKNTLVRLGDGIEPIIYGIGGDSQRHAEGLPLGHYYGREFISWEDKNGDGLIGLDEVEVGSEPTMLGRQFPTREFSLSSTFTLFDYVRLYALIDHKGGHQLFNSTEEFRCEAFGNCRGMHDPDAPQYEQARAMARLKGSIDGYIEDADFTKLREVSLTLLGIEKWLGHAGLSGLDNVSLTISGRNLHTWTKYSGFDPEMNSGGQANMSTFDFLGQPPVRSWTVRLNVGF